MTGTASTFVGRRLGRARGLGLRPALVAALLLLSSGQLAWAQSEETWQQRFMKLLHAERSLSEGAATPRAEAIRSLGHLGPTVVPLLESLYRGQTHDPEVRVANLAALARVGPDHGVLRVLQAALSDPEEQVVVTAAACLQSLEWAGEPILIHALRTHPSDNARFYSACGLWVSTGNPEQVRGLIECLDDVDPHVRAVVLFCLSREFTRSTETWGWDTPESLATKREIEALAAACTPDLVELFEREPLPNVRTGALLALGDRSFETVVRGLGDPSSEVRGVAASCLGRHYGDHPLAASLIPVVVTLLFESSPRTREFAAAAVMNLGTRDRFAIAVLFHLSYYDPDLEVRVNVRRYLRSIFRPRRSEREGR